MQSVIASWGLELRLAVLVVASRVIASCLPELCLLELCLAGRVALWVPDLRQPAHWSERR